MTGESVERRRTEDKELAVALALLDERWKAVSERLDQIDARLVVANGLRVQMAALEARGKFTYAILTLIVGGLIGLAFRVLGA